VIGPVNQQRTKVYLFYINDLRVISPNIVNGVSLYISWKNISDRTLKYVIFEVVSNNPVGDLIECDIMMAPKNVMFDPSKISYK
jgi:hypothetical protein